MNCEVSEANPAVNTDTARYCRAAPVTFTLGSGLLPLDNMDYFQGVVTEFLRAKRTTFVNTEYLIQLDAGNVYAKGRHWYCDVIAVDHADRTVHLCEVTYSKTMQPLLDRLQAWSYHWPGVVAAIRRDSLLEGQWYIQPRLFVPEKSCDILLRKIAVLTGHQEPELNMPSPMVTYMEDVLPWMYRSWNGMPYKDEADA
jgi:hypothetical protein